MPLLQIHETLDPRHPPADLDGASVCPLTYTLPLQQLMVLTPAYPWTTLCLPPACTYSIRAAIRRQEALLQRVMDGLQDSSEGTRQTEKGALFSGGLIPRWAVHQPYHLDHRSGGSQTTTEINPGLQRLLLNSRKQSQLGPCPGSPGPDFVTGIPPSGGNMVILTVVGGIYKPTHFILLPKLPSAKEAAASSPLDSVWLFALSSDPRRACPWVITQSLMDRASKP
ncbi:hypothetical protein DPEC_G00146780 [Dallia pectoralis]|uniref:Uncharacterized protein n=1 Tax=Dallia pectoralis TaxID=75939 RepID=A0ACC2GPM6_DALPE|nr:hypothetical protein DPEC_G00146780 [Dallia pectoralis]